MKTYDIVIIGGGTAGIFAAYELNKLNPDSKIAIIEQGHPIRCRVCPIVEGKVKTCINCKNCSIMNGFGGAGAFQTVSLILLLNLADGLMIIFRIVRLWILSNTLTV